VNLGLSALGMWVTHLPLWESRRVPDSSSVPGAHFLARTLPRGSKPLPLTHALTRENAIFSFLPKIKEEAVHVWKFIPSGSESGSWP